VSTSGAWRTARGPAAGLVAAWLACVPAAVAQDVGSLPSVPPLAPGTAALAPPEAGPLAAERGDAENADDEYARALRILLPMSPEEIRRLRDLVQRNRDAILSRDVMPLVVSTRIGFDPSAAPETVIVSPGIATALSFVDATGQPWPISRHTIGDGSAFQVLRTDESEGGHALTITPLLAAGGTNLVIHLQEATMPLVFMVRIDADRAHVRHDILVSALGPHAAPTGAEPRVIGQAGNPLLLVFLSGADLPEGSTRVRVSGVEAEAWLHGDQMFLRSRHALISPSWSSSLAGPNDYQVWQLDPASQLLFTIAGRVHRARVDL